MASSDSIAKQILKRRTELVGELLSGPLGKELTRLDAAYVALTGDEAPPLLKVVQVKSTAPTGEPAAGKATVSRHFAKRAIPVKFAARQLMANTDRDWSYDEILEHWHDEGVRFNVKNERDALRTAMLQLVNDGVVEKVDRGRYRPAKRQVPTLEGFESDPEDDEGGGAP